jgi:hypothetical protein
VTGRRLKGVRKKRLVAGRAAVLRVRVRPGLRRVRVTASDDAGNRVKRRLRVPRAN